MTAHRRWYRGAIVWGRRTVFAAAARHARASVAVGAAVACVAVAAGCGGGARQDAGERAGTFSMEVVKASFPSRQSIARPTRLELRVRNTGTHTVPDVAITVDSLSYTSSYPELAANKRPVWAIERGPGPVAKPPVETQEVSIPGGGQTAYVNTWALGALRAGATQTFTWHVVPVRAGVYTVHYTVAAGLAGKAKARLSSGGSVAGALTVDVAAAPPSTHVDPATGRVVSGMFPATP